eukprot:gene12520-biopygen2617
MEDATPAASLRLPPALAAAGRGSPPPPPAQSVGWWEWKWEWKLRWELRWKLRRMALYECHNGPPQGAHLLANVSVRTRDPPGRRDPSPSPRQPKDDDHPSGRRAASPRQPPPFSAAAVRGGHATPTIMMARDTGGRPGVAPDATAQAQPIRRRNGIRTTIHLRDSSGVPPALSQLGTTAARCLSSGRSDAGRPAAAAAVPRRFARLERVGSAAMAEHITMCVPPASPPTCAARTRHDGSGRGEHT